VTRSGSSAVPKWMDMMQSMATGDAAGFRRTVRRVVLVFSVLWAASMVFGDVVVYKAGGRHVQRYDSRLHVGGLPLLSIGRTAHGVFAFGGLATGVVAVGGVAVGIIAYGPLSVGVVAIGAVSVGLFSMAAIALGWRAVGAIALGHEAVGAVAVGSYACGAIAYGRKAASGHLEGLIR
jgi:hypothetical protein